MYSYKRPGFVLVFILRWQLIGPTIQVLLSGVSFTPRQSLVAQADSTASDGLQLLTFLPGVGVTKVSAYLTLASLC